GRIRGGPRARAHRRRGARADDLPAATTQGNLMGIEAPNVTKRYGEFTALDDVTVTVPDGSLTALLGPSGGGKSTLLRVIAGLEVPDSGVVHIAGDDVTGAPAQRRGVGFVFQHYAPFRHMTLRD